jgi:hypothetical protein
MADILAALTGAIQGYSSGSGLDLAQKLREQAALDEQALKTFQAKEEIRAAIERQGVEEDRAFAEEQRKQELTAQLHQLLPSARAAGVHLEGFEGGDLQSRLGELTGSELGTLTSAMIGETSAITGQAALEAAEAKAEQESRKTEAEIGKIGAETVAKGTSAAKDVALANFYNKRAESLNSETAKDPTIRDYKFFNTEQGVFATTTAPDGSLVTMQVPGVPPDASDESAKAAARVLGQVYTAVSQEAMMDPGSYALVDESGVPVVENGQIKIDWERVGQVASSRASSMTSAVFNETNRPGVGAVHPSGGSQGSPFFNDLQGTDLSDEEKAIFTDLESQAAAGN